MVTVTVIDVYCNNKCRALFRQPRNAALRKAKLVRDLVQRHRLSVWLYSENQLVAILRSLLQDQVFESDYTARHTFPELFHSPEPQPTPAASTDVKPSAVSESIMTLQESIRASVLERRARLLDTGDQSDIIIVAGKEYYAHQIIICEFSDVLKSSCQFERQRLTSTGEQPAKEEAKQLRSNARPLTLTLDLSAHDPVAVDCMLQFFYCLDYDSRSIIAGGGGVLSETAEGERITQPSLLTHVLVHKIANYYMVDELKKLALLKFSAEVKKPVQPEDFVAATREAYCDMHECFDALRKEVIHAIHLHRKQLLPDTGVKDLLSSNGMIGYDSICYFSEKI
ncbi:hypothetical protein BM221_008983 [Beauveria bassiana]|uniref:Uncharacterized protein n=1 Tax=Beauveria bassiana TaxID=176275 RepID=A0A2N6NEF0_BEABA|nr:hypothetical protein BM221_008983 [Beauveria bassiana]